MNRVDLIIGPSRELLRVRDIHFGYVFGILAGHYPISMRGFPRISIPFVEGFILLSVKSCRIPSPRQHNHTGKLLHIDWQRIAPAFHLQGM